MVNIRVQKAVKLKDPGTLKELPVGFPFLVDDDSGQIIEPVLYFLRDEALGPVPHGWSRNTTLAWANDLKDWWEFLAVRGLSWDEITTDDFAFYRDALSVTVSPRTHEVYKPQTVRRISSSIENFYRWAREKGYFGIELRRVRSSPRFRPIDQDALAHLRRNSANLDKSRDSYARAGGYDPVVHAHTPESYRQICKHLGPLPSEQANDPRPCRDRLAAEFSLETGCRVDEVASINLWSILDLAPDSSQPFACQRLRITKTKGLVPRTIFIPNWLLSELVKYIDGERAQSLEFAKKYWMQRTADVPRTLFVNRPDAGFNAGRPTRPESLQDSVRLSCLAAGLTKSVEKIDPSTMTTRREWVNRHTFHDFRHTFAVWRYFAEKEAGNSEPWKVIQGLLGHQHLSTTLNIYLNAVNVEEAQVSDRVAQHLARFKHG